MILCVLLIVSSQRTNAPNAMSMHIVKMENASVMEVTMARVYEENAFVLEVRIGVNNEQEEKNIIECFKTVEKQSYFSGKAPS